MTRWRAAAAAVAVTVALSGCGDDDPAISPDGASALLPRVAAVRLAAEEGDGDAARVALDDLARWVGMLEDSGELTPERAIELRVAIGQVEEMLALLPPATTTTTSTTAPPEDKGEEDDDDEDERRPGKGRDKDD